MGKSITRPSPPAGGSGVESMKTIDMNINIASINEINIKLDKILSALLTIQKLLCNK